MRIFLVLPIFFLFASCTLPGTQDESGANTFEISGTESLVRYANHGIQINVPKNWKEVTASDVPTPKYGSVVTAWISPEIKYGFANNLVIMRDTLSSIVTSQKYSELNFAQTTRNYLEYNKLAEAEMVFSDDEVSKVYTFEARYNQTSPKMKFVQTARVCGTSVYLLHFSLSLDRSVEKYIELLKSFTCK